MSTNRRAVDDSEEHSMQDPLRAVVVMGVSGCGKTSVAAALAERIGARMIEGDTYHPAQNVQKMQAGIPLTDTDRQGWLEQLAAELTRAVAMHEVAILTCSALKRRYRDLLRSAMPNLGFVFLDLSPAAATERVKLRSGHFMPATLVQSQFRDLEPPTDEPLVLTVDASDSLQVIVARAQAWWNASRATGAPS
jgi:gluconokinase